MTARCNALEEFEFWDVPVINDLSSLSYSCTGLDDDIFVVVELLEGAVDYRTNFV